MIRIAASLLVSLGLIAATPAQAGAEQLPGMPAAMAFDTMKTLLGVWRIKDEPDNALRIMFRQTAGGWVIVESWEREGRPHSLTLYHRDGDGMIATHYCPQGNQPRLALTGAVARRTGKLHFVFRDVTDLDSGESYLVDLAFDLSDPKILLRREVYRSAKGDEASELRLVRVE